MTVLSRFFLVVLLFQVLLAASCSGKSKDAVPTATSPAYVEAQELKLKIRELADQMLATTPNSALDGLVAMPTSFVDLDNKARTSGLGNLFGESLIYEFNQRGFPVREYHLTGNIDVILGQGDFALLRKGLVSTANQKWAALIVGTYYRTKDAVFINARLVRANDGMVLRTGQLVLVNNALVASLSQPILPPPPPSTPVMPTAPMKPPLPTADISSGKMTIKPAPWPAQRTTTKKGPGLWSSPAQ